MLIESNTKKYIDECTTKAKYHRDNALNGLNWYNLLSITNVLLTSSQALVMTILSVYQSDDISIAITGASFAFVVAVFNRINTSYQFNVLSYQHNTVADDYLELSKFFEIDVEEGLYHKHVLRFISITEKSHIPPIKKCHLLFLCCGR